MMNFTELQDFCLDLPGVDSDFPFDDQTLVFRVGGKMFALVNVSLWHAGTQKINLKCDPVYAIKLRDLYASITPGYHMNKNHWNTIDISEGELEKGFILKLIQDSYNLVFEGLPRKKKESID